MKTSKKIQSFVEAKLIQDDLVSIAGERFGRYSKYVIQDRALPDVRDGLKPVQRRILYAMYKLGTLSNKPYKKSARIAGEVMGKFHPHGGDAIYDAMVRMSQRWKNNLPTVDMHGNNGSIDGDSAAAMRYTEARLSLFAELLLQDINKKTVGFVPNFDDEELEPVVLPAKYPNLLVNGSTGISSGYATDIPPHNINEVIAGVIYRINNPTCKLKDLMTVIPGPDFPTGGIIQGQKEIVKAYTTGRGKIVIRSKVEIKELKNGNSVLEITELPYDVNKALLVRRMNDSYLAKNVAGIVSIRDESDRQGLKIVVEIRKGTSPEAIRDFFFKSTDLQINYNFNIVAIADKRPVQLGLLDIIDYYIAHQKEVMTNRSNFELKSAQRRRHIVDGLIAMTSILDAVIQTIRNSVNKKDAKNNLVSLYDFTEEQAEAIVMLQLYRLTNTDIVALTKEQAELGELITQLEAILSDEKLLLAAIKKELMETQSQVTSPRKSVIEAKTSEIQVKSTDVIAKEDCYLLVTKEGYVKRISDRFWELEKGEVTLLKPGDVITNTFALSTVDTVIMFTNLGNYVYLPVHKIPEVRHKDLGYHVSTLCNVEAEEKVISSAFISDFKAETYFMFATASGLIKLTPVSEFDAVRYSRALRATKLADGDKLVSVQVVHNLAGKVIVATSQGYMSMYPVKEVSRMAPASFGVKSIELKSRPDDRVVGAVITEPGDFVFALTRQGAIRRYRPADFVLGHKNNVGKIMFPVNKKQVNALTHLTLVRKAALPDKKLKAYVFGTESWNKIDFLQAQGATATGGKKLIKEAIGTAEELVFERTNADV